jgi:hypothetical protein
VWLTCLISKTPAKEIQMSIQTSTGIRCGNTAYHGREHAVYHVSTDAVRECFANSGRFRAGQQVGKTQVAREQEQALIAQAAAEQAEREARRAAAARYAAWSTIPVFARGRAYYALEVNGKVRFFRIERPTEGKWKGKTFVAEQAGDTFYKMDFHPGGAILDRIAVEHEEAGVRYGREINKCYRCHRTLTDTESRAAGIGPDCRKKG